MASIYDFLARAPALGLMAPLGFPMDITAQAQAIAANWLAAATAQQMQLHAAASLAALPQVDLSDPALEANANSGPLELSLPPIEYTPPQTPAPSPPRQHRPAPAKVYDSDSSSERSRPAPLHIGFHKRKPQGRRRSVKELARAYTCPHESCGRRYEAWRSLQAHLYSKHGERKKKTDYPQFDDLHIRGITPADGLPDDCDSDDTVPPASPTDTATPSTTASSAPGSPALHSLSLPHFDNVALEASLGELTSLSTGDLAMGELGDLDLDLDSLMDSLLA